MVAGYIVSWMALATLVAMVDAQDVEGAQNQCIWASSQHQLCACHEYFQSEEVICQGVLSKAEIMTQEYTPTDNDVKADYVRAFCSARNTKNWSENSVKGERAFNRCPAAHDAQIRAEEHVKALELTDYELEMLEDARSNSDEWAFGKDIKALKIGIEAVAKYRKEQKQ